MAQQKLVLTGDKDQLDLSNTTEVLYFFAYRAHKTDHPDYVNAQILAAALKMLSSSQVRQLIGVLEETEQTVAQLESEGAF